MGTIHRYILKEVIKTFLFGLIVFTALIVIVMVGKEALKQGLPPLVALRMIPYTIPQQLRVSIPVTLLLAATTFFARMSGSNEIIALKSSGVPPWKVMWPVLLLSFVLGVFSIWIHEFGITWGTKKITQVMIAGAEEIIYSNLRTKQTLPNLGAGVSIKVKGVENKTILSPLITLGEDKIAAQSATIRMDHVKETLTFELHNLYGSGKDSMEIKAEKYEHVVALSEIIPTSSSSDRPSEMPMAQMPAAKEKHLQNQTTACNQVAAETAFTLCSGDFEEFSSPRWEAYDNRLESIQSTLNRLYLEPQRRYAAGFSCFFFVWVGANLAIWIKRSDIFASFFVCFLPILIIYYPFMELFTRSGKHGTALPIFIWTANICLGLIGIWFFKRIHRY